jgi:hypothetical protein
MIDSDGLVIDINNNAGKTQSRIGQKFLLKQAPPKNRQLSHY